MIETFVEKNEKRQPIKQKSTNKSLKRLNIQKTIDTINIKKKKKSYLNLEQNTHTNT